jgi:hypothetical protein
MSVSTANVSNKGRVNRQGILVRLFRTGAGVMSASKTTPLVSCTWEKKAAD